MRQTASIRTLIVNLGRLGNQVTNLGGLIEPPHKVMLNTRFQPKVTAHGDAVGPRRHTLTTRVAPYSSHWPERGNSWRSSGNPTLSPTAAPQGKRPLGHTTKSTILGHGESSLTCGVVTRAYPCQRVRPQPAFRPFHCSR